MHEPRLSITLVFLPSCKIMFKGESMEGKRKRDEEACTKWTLEVSDSVITS
ncbi:hypothetical protein HanPSC8_Chr05g0216751 [Helianthus annuus]|uniref:Uncharacterized protein n=1 Tax=Helianthus annuus TaxID=4232 RepID=A0A251UQW6_HELAN|nr:hypothetical protein HanPSC8_Chr05g0216751 [Helianthus annuus]